MNCITMATLPKKPPGVPLPYLIIERLDQMLLAYQDGQGQSWRAVVESRSHLVVLRL